MSSRQLRKIRQQQERLKAADPANSEVQELESEDAEYKPVVKPRLSIFAALGGNNDDIEQESENDEVDGEKLEETMADLEPKPNASSKKKKKKRKKAKKNQAAAAAGERNEVWEAKEESEDEIDRALKELNITPQEGGKEQRAMDPNRILYINPHNLRDIHELRQLFGRDTIDVVEQEEQEQERAERRGMGRRRRRMGDMETFLKGDPKKPLPEITLRKNIFIQGKTSWPRDTSRGLSMKEVGKAEDGSWVEYTYHHDTHYDSDQVLFFGTVGLGDPMRLVHLLKTRRKYWNAIDDATCHTD